ncbi:sulfite exporter TauE/SafE family protein [Bacteriovorax sp. PP10]|uniref:Sulfite exporter TauE/SafE family protein n=1 Tax=Bacteriovorax antarcticus TaxID=3088717 RepID=A0ABU5VX52_9BACT|nr:sulfite exporter TauE/SafE family protein [Bacteriovorax sp. PP10]MEA9357643.1 sulfite exporter TauE/SafE family protein [Bacteriovorax sp. PP10]
MSDLLTNFQNFFPWVSFIAGLGGSLHCVGMCGGLVTATCDKNNDIIRYQLGRLLGYLGLGLFAGFIGSLFKFEQTSPAIAIIPGLVIGLLFLYWGIQNWRGKKAELPMPKFMGKLYSYLWKKLVYKNVNFSKSFFTGLISIFLPCGLLYGVVLGGVAVQHPLMALISMFFFWLGTVPSMVTAPHILRKILNPLRNKLPKTYGATLVLIGLLTVSFRVMAYYDLHSKAKESGIVTEHMCH